jgi:hypothetical protein
MLLSMVERRALPTGVFYALKMEATHVSETVNSLPDYTLT